MNMANNKFLINDLSSLEIPLKSDDYTIVEREEANTHTTYKIAFSDIYKDVVLKRISADVAKPDPFGPNILSISYIDDSGSLINAVSV